MKDNEYFCEQCHGIFEKGWSDEECEAEALENFKDVDPHTPMLVVCDDCYKLIYGGDIIN